MRLQQLTNAYIDPSAVTYISPPDTHVKAHVGVVIHFVKVIVGGQPVELVAQTKEEILEIRRQLVELCQSEKV